MSRESNGVGVDQDPYHHGTHIAGAAFSATKLVRQSLIKCGEMNTLTMPQKLMHYPSKLHHK
jgi:hypothetical protein